MTFRAKLLLAQAPLAVVLALVCVLSVVMISTLGSHSQTILKDNYRSVLAAQRMKEAAERLDDSLTLSLLKGQPEEVFKQASTYRQQFEQELQVQEGNITESGEHDATQRLRTRWNDYQQKINQFREIKTPEAAKQLYFTELETAFRALRATLEEILAINQDSMVRKSEEVRRTATRLNTLTITAALSALLLGLFLSTLLTNRLLRPLSVLSQVTRRLGAGDFQARVNIPGNDEIAQLAREFNAMASHLADYRNSSLGELLHAQESLQAAIDSLPDPVVVFGVTGDMRNVNRAAEIILGLHIETTTHDPLQDADPSVRAVLEKLRTHVLSGNGPVLPKGFEDAIRVSAREGDTYLLPRATPVYEMGGTLIGATVILQEVTRLRRFDELKNNLVSTVAHEFRTPLTSLRMAIHLCLEQAVGPITEKQADLLHAAREDCERLQAMVDDLLDLSRMEAGRVELHLRAVSPTTLIKGAAETHRALAEEQGIRLRTMVSANENAVFADPERIAIVLANLVTNALRHTPAGGQITLAARPIHNHVRFEVTDTGTGIPHAYQARVFDKFFRVPGASGGAAGLGLSIVKEIVEEHEGKIGLDSEEGEGSTFWFTLPCTTTHSTEEAVQL
jgi:NtrC-family two-component system sensor histidine kinase KinB